MSAIRFVPHILSPAARSLRRDELTEEPVLEGTEIQFTDRGAREVRIDRIPMGATVEVYADQSRTKLEKTSIRRLADSALVTVPHYAKSRIAVSRGGDVLALRLYVDRLMPGDHSWAYRVRGGALVNEPPPELDLIMKAVRRAYPKRPNAIPVEVVQQAPTGAFRASLLKALGAEIIGEEHAATQLQEGHLQDQLQRYWPNLLQLAQRTNPSDWPHVLDTIVPPILRFAPKSS